MGAFLLSAIAAATTLSGVAYWGLTLASARRFVKQRAKRVRSGFTPAVSILKPLCGLEPQAYDSLRSHCTQDYPAFEIIFGVKDSDDPIVPTVERLIREFPDIPIRLVIC